MFGVKTDTEEGYFLAGRFMTWIPVGILSTVWMC